jgi:ribonuclease HI
MVNNGIDVVVKNEQIYVNLNELLDGLYGVCNKWAVLHSGPNETEAAQRLSGMIDLCEGLDDLHQIWRAREGLT